MRRKRFCIFLLLMVVITVVSGCNKKLADNQTINNEITDVEITDGKEMSEDSYDDYRESNHKNHHEDEHH